MVTAKVKEAPEIIKDLIKGWIKNHHKTEQILPMAIIYLIIAFTLQQVKVHLCNFKKYSVWNSGNRNYFEVFLHEIQKISITFKKGVFCMVRLMFETSTNYIDICLYNGTYTVNDNAKPILKILKRFTPYRFKNNNNTNSSISFHVVFIDCCQETQRIVICIDYDSKDEHYGYIDVQLGKPMHFEEGSDYPTKMIAFINDDDEPIHSKCISHELECSAAMHPDIDISPDTVIGNI